MLSKFNRTERALLLTAISIDLLVLLVIFAAVAVTTLRPSSTPIPTFTPVVLPTRTPTP